MSIAPKNRNPRILYIAGDGRNGSTFLSIVLGNHTHIVAGGELSFLLDDWENERRVCSCGQGYAHCSTWRDLFSDPVLSGTDKSLIRRVEHIENLLGLLMGRTNSQDHQRYRDFHQTLFGRIATFSKASIVVDSSKSARAAAGRAVALCKLAGFEVFVLHLVRDGVATMESALLKGSNWWIEGHVDRRRWSAPRAALGWTLANLSAAITGRVVGRDHYLRMHYDDLVCEPATSLRQIGEFCGFDAEELTEGVDEGRGFQAGHVSGGNRLRFQKEVRFERSGLRDKNPKLSRTQRLTFQLIGGWLNWFYRRVPSNRARRYPSKTQNGFGD